jgi:hypothetical protein
MWQQRGLRQAIAHDWFVGAVQPERVAAESEVTSKPDATTPNKATRVCCTCVRQTLETRAVDLAQSTKHVT